jgi:hypothetical protein
MTQDDILQWAHRTAWRYKKSSDPHHSDTYTFNADTLAAFASLVRSSALEEAAAEADYYAKHSVNARTIATAIRALKQGSDSGHSPALAGEASTGGGANADQA